jgi:predicted transcriptional regulator
MDPEKKKRLQAKGWKVGGFEDFLELDEAEAALVRMKLNASRALRQRREEANMTQVAFAEKIESSQSRVAKMESGQTPSLDRMVTALIKAGATPQEAVMSLLAQ